MQSDVLSVEEIQAVLADLETNEPWYDPLFLLWLSTGMRNAEIRGLTWDCIRWEEGEVLVLKSLQPCGLKPRRLYAQRHSFLSHALAIGNSPADLAAAAGHSTKMQLDTYAKPIGRLKPPTCQTA